MSVEVAVTVDAPKSRVWRTVADIENAADTISAIERIEVLEKPHDGLLGLKWRETRTMYGKAATETMWISDVDDESYYVTEAQSHGSVYRTEVRVAEEGGKTRLSMVFDAEAETFGARVMSAMMGFVVNRAVKKNLLQDLQDVKRAAESRVAP